MPLGAAFQVANGHTADHAARAVSHSDGWGIVEECRPRGDRGPGQVDQQAGVIKLTVVVDDTASQPSRLNGW